MIEILLQSGYTPEEAKYYMNNHHYKKGDVVDEILLEKEKEQP